MKIPNMVCSLSFLDIGKRRDMLLETRSTLQDKSAKRKVKLADSYLYQQFDRYANLSIQNTTRWWSPKSQLTLVVPHLQIRSNETVISSDEMSTFQTDFLLAKNTGLPWPL